MTVHFSGLVQALQQTDHLKQVVVQS